MAVLSGWVMGYSLLVMREVTRMEHMKLLFQECNAHGGLQVPGLWDPVGPQKRGRLGACQLPR
ncbi:hypothetical protein GCM10009771_00910 [Nesterenkonia flava]